MAAAGKPCPLCKALLHHRIVDTLAGEEGPLRITLHDMPALSCDKPHLFFVRPDFPSWLLNHLVEEDEPALPAGEARGLVFKSYLCHDCGKPLSSGPDHQHSFPVTLAYEEEPRFRAEISMPVFRCTACGKEQVHSLAEVRKLTPTALVQAFKSAGIKAPA